MQVEDRLQALREQVDKTSEISLAKLRKAAHMLYEEVTFPDLTHDNIKVILADHSPFSYSLDENKQQVVVILKGEWKMEYGKISKNLFPTDVIKVPLESKFAVKLSTSEIDAKFVYVQFK